MTGDQVELDAAEVRATVEAIEALGSLPDGHPGVVEGRVLDGAAISSRRPVPAPSPFRIGGALGGVPEDAPEQERYRANRADRRRLSRRGRRTG